MMEVCPAKSETHTLVHWSVVAIFQLPRTSFRCFSDQWLTISYNNTDETPAPRSVACIVAKSIRNKPTKWLRFQYNLYSKICKIYFYCHFGAFCHRKLFIKRLFVTAYYFLKVIYH